VDIDRANKIEAHFVGTGQERCRKEDEVSWQIGVNFRTASVLDIVSRTTEP